MEDFKDVSSEKPKLRLWGRSWVRVLEGNDIFGLPRYSFDSALDDNEDVFNGLHEGDRVQVELRPDCDSGELKAILVPASESPAVSIYMIGTERKLIPEDGGQIYIIGLEGELIPENETDHHNNN